METLGPDAHGFHRDISNWVARSDIKRPQPRACLTTQRALVPAWRVEPRQAKAAGCILPCPEAVRSVAAAFGRVLEVGRHLLEQLRLRYTRCADVTGRSPESPGPLLPSWAAPLTKPAHRECTLTAEAPSLWRATLSLRMTMAPLWERGLSR